MSYKMLVDATQPEETRVAIVSEKDNRLQNFDFETTVIKQIKGNIYLAKVTRVEPSLQAAFLEYGGNRQGFLPFSEIHPDYFKIPVEDKEKLLEQEKAAVSQAIDEDDEDIIDVEEDEQEEVIDSEDEDQNEDDDIEGSNDDESDEDDEVSVDDVRAAKEADAEDEIEEEIEEAKPQFRISHRNYKIQEVIKPRQIMLIQVSKEERGNKGAAISTYISLPGRYCVLMPNSSHGGGISRKISNQKDRKKMKEVLASLDVPEGMSVILRTAGIERTKAEIKRDLDYLLRMWDNIRKTTLESTAPALIYEEGNLIKRSIRDLYSKDINEVLVAGKDGHKQAKDFMKMLMPSHAKKVKEYKKGDSAPIFQAHGIEKQIDDTFSVEAAMPSGGYIVINPTEALVSIDVNSGKATKERHIEETALRTNLEAAEEVARQLRLRDLGGLVVIDFIDMETYRHNRQVEKRLKECLSKDRARVQVGKISNFGLLELSRQRLRPSLFETNFHECPTCQGMGRVRTVESSALMVLRAVEEEAINNGGGNIFVKGHADVALYILNQKRALLSKIEKRHKAIIFINVKEGLMPGQYEISRTADVPAEEAQPVQKKSGNNNKPRPQHNHNNNNDDGGKKRKRRGRRGGRRRNVRKDQNSSDNQSENQNDSNANKPSSDNNKKPEAKSDNKSESKKDVKSDKKKPSPKGQKKTAAKKEDKKDGGKVDSSQKDSSKAEKKETKSKSKPKKEAKPAKQSQAEKSEKPSNDNAGEKKGTGKGGKKGWWKRLTE